MASGKALAAAASTKPGDKGKTAPDGAVATSSSAELQKQLQAVMERVNALEKQRERDQGELADMRERLGQVEAELQQAHQRAEEAEQRAQEAEQRAAQAEQETQEARQQQQQATAAADTLQAELDKANLSLASHKYQAVAHQVVVGGAAEASEEEVLTTIQQRVPGLVPNAVVSAEQRRGVFVVSMRSREAAKKVVMAKANIKAHKPDWFVRPERTAEEARYMRSHRQRFDQLREQGAWPMVRGAQFTVMVNGNRVHERLWDRYWNSLTAGQQQQLAARAAPPPPPRSNQQQRQQQQQGAGGSDAAAAAPAGGAADGAGAPTPGVAA
jgi:Skp family chaperone for outer membrane proteins